MCREGAVVFGGSGEGVLLDDLWLLRLEPSMLWERPAAAGVAPTPRAYHSAVLRAATSADGVEQIIFYGGNDVSAETAGRPPRA